jgi:hypothetical protein
MACVCCDSSDLDVLYTPRTRRYSIVTSQNNEEFATMGDLVRSRLYLNYSFVHPAAVVCDNPALMAPPKLPSDAGLPPPRAADEPEVVPAVGAVSRRRTAMDALLSSAFVSRVRRAKVRVLNVMSGVATPLCFRGVHLWHRWPASTLVSVAGALVALQALLLFSAWRDVQGVCALQPHLLRDVGAAAVASCTHALLTCV